MNALSIILILAVVVVVAVVLWRRRTATARNAAARNAAEGGIGEVGKKTNAAMNGTAWWDKKFYNAKLNPVTKGT